MPPWFVHIPWHWLPHSAPLWHTPEGLGLLGGILLALVLDAATPSPPREPPGAR